ncbi:MAG: hypothetical protein KY434_02535 [Actinobacteria bacterium]|nr:hypothetical protein [Actinomycetota bacterium]
MGERLPELVRRWRAAEERLYTVVMVVPEHYERRIRLVRAVADELRSSSTPEELAAAYPRAPDLVATASRRLGLLPEDVGDVELVAGAAFSLRYGEVLEETHRDRAARRARTAREAGHEWVVLYETGSPETGLLAPYRRLEMHLPDGLGLHVFVEPHPETMRAVYGVEAVQLDPASGDWVADSRLPAQRQTFAAREPWVEAVADRRRRYGNSAASRGERGP